LLLLISINLFIIDIKLFSNDANIKVAQISTTNQKDPYPLVEQNENLTSQSCPAGCLSLFANIATQSAIPLGEAQFPTSTQTQSSTASKESYVPLGTGNTDKSDWTDLTATETVIDPSYYPNIQYAYFIVTLRNPTQNGQTEARLYNVTDNYVVYGSHIVMNGPKEQTLTSAKFAMPSGAKTYRVQLRSTLSYPSYLDNAKLRIVYQ
jgi:hypothetical protein